MSINVTVKGNSVCCSNKNHLLADPNVTKKTEVNRRRKLRLEQVRQQSKDLASHLRQEFRKERLKQINKFEQEQISELAKWQARKLLSLQEKYQECLGQVGTGHRQAAEEPDYGSILAEQQSCNQSAAKQRGKVAGHKAKKESEEAAAKANEVGERHKLSRTVEDLRSTMISSIGKAVRKSKTKDKPLQEIIVNVPGDNRETRIKTTRTIAGEDHHETVVKTFYKGPSPAKSKMKRKSVLKTSKKGEIDSSLTLDFSALNKSGTLSSLEITDAAGQAASGRTGFTYTLDATSVGDTRRSATSRNTRNVSASVLPTIDASQESEDIPNQRQSSRRNQESKGKQSRQEFTLETRMTADEEIREVGVQVGAAKPPTKETSRVPQKGRVSVTRHSTKEAGPGENEGQSCYCPENPGPGVESESDMSDPYCSQPPNATLSVPSNTTTTTTGASKVRMYDHGGRHHREYAVPDVVERMPRTQRSTCESDHVSHLQLAALQAQAVADAQKAHGVVAKERGQKALTKEMVRRDYVKLIGDLESLSREERLVRGTLLPSAAPEVHMSDQRRRERTSLRQRNMDSAFEAVLHRTALPGTAHRPEPTTTASIAPSAPSRRSPPLATPTKLNVGPPLAAPFLHTMGDQPVLVIPFSPAFSEGSVTIGRAPPPTPQSGQSDEQDGRSRGEAKTARPMGSSRSPGGSGRASASPERPGRISSARPVEPGRPGRESPGRSGRRPSSARYRNVSPTSRETGQRASPERPGRKSPSSERTGRHSPVSRASGASSPNRQTPSPETRRSPDSRRSAGPSRSPASSRSPEPNRSGGTRRSLSSNRSASPSSLDVISLDALMARVHAQRALLLAEVGRGVLAALPRDAPFLKRVADKELSDSSSSSSAGTEIDPTETKVKQLWSERSESPSPRDPAAKPNKVKRPRKKQRPEPTNTDTDGSRTETAALDAGSQEDATTSTTTSFEGVQIVVSVVEKDPRRDREKGEVTRLRIPARGLDETDRASGATSKTSPPTRKPGKPSRDTTQSTSTSYNSPPPQLDPGQPTALSSLLHTISRQQAKLEGWKTSLSSRLKPSASLEAYVDKLLDMSKRSIDVYSDASHVSTPATSVVDNPLNRDDDDDALDSLLRERVEDIAQELLVLERSTEEGSDRQVLRLLTEHVRQRNKTAAASDQDGSHATPGAETDEPNKGPPKTRQTPAGTDDAARRRLKGDVGQPGKHAAANAEAAERERRCAERISCLADRIERVRRERQRIVDSSTSVGTEDSTRYESPPLESTAPAHFPVLVPLGTRPRSPRSNGEEDTRYVSPPSNVASPSQLTTRLSPPPGEAANRRSPPPVHPANRNTADVGKATRHKPPATLWRNNARTSSPTGRAHELSTIAEVDTPCHESQRHESQRHESQRHESQRHETQRHEMSELPDVMAEMLRRQLISSPLRLSRDTTSSTAGGSSLDSRGEHRSSPEDLDRVFTQLGFGWACATLRKTQATKDLSSSSSPESFDRPRRREASETPGRQTPQTSSRTPGSPPRTARDQSTPKRRGGGGARSSGVSFRAGTDVSTVHGSGSDRARS